MHEDLLHSIGESRAIQEKRKQGAWNKSRKLKRVENKLKEWLVTGEKEGKKFVSEDEGEELHR